jgi:hypothetical protein
MGSNSIHQPNSQKYTFYLERSLRQTTEMMKDSSCSRRSKSQFVFRLEHEFRRVLYETEQGFITTTQTKFGYQHLFHYGLAILIDVLLAHPRYIPQAVRRRCESQVHGDIDNTLKRMGINALYGRPETPTSEHCGWSATFARSYRCVFLRRRPLFTYTPRHYLQSSTQTSPAGGS